MRSCTHASVARLFASVSHLCSLAQALPFYSLDMPEGQIWRAKREPSPSPLSVRPSFAEEERLFTKYSQKLSSPKSARKSSCRGSPAAACGRLRSPRERNRATREVWSRPVVVDDEKVAQALMLAVLSKGKVVRREEGGNGDSLPSRGVQPELS